MALRKNLIELQQLLSDQKDTVQSGSKDLISYNRRIKFKERALHFARSRYIGQCIRHRNDQSSEAIRNDNKATLTEMGRQAHNDLQVFPVSATIHQIYQTWENTGNSEKRSAGFPNRTDTGVPALRDWLYGTTLDDRERIAQAFLDDVDEFLAKVQPWLMDKFGQNKMPLEVRGQWEPQIESLVTDLEAVCILSSYFRLASC
jgi:hypothetical protein